MIVLRCAETFIDTVYRHYVKALINIKNTDFKVLTREKRRANIGRAKNLRRAEIRARQKIRARKKEGAPKILGRARRAINIRARWARGRAGSAGALGAKERKARGRARSANIWKARRRARRAI